MNHIKNECIKNEIIKNELIKNECIKNELIKKRTDPLSEHLKNPPCFAHRLLTKVKYLFLLKTTFKVLLSAL